MSIKGRSQNCAQSPKYSTHLVLVRHQSSAGLLFHSKKFELNTFHPLGGSTIAIYSPTTCSVIKRPRSAEYMFRLCNTLTCTKNILDEAIGALLLDDGVEARLYVAPRTTILVFLLHPRDLCLGILLQLRKYQVKGEGGQLEADTFTSTHCGSNPCWIIRITIQQSPDRTMHSLGVYFRVLLCRNSKSTMY